MTQPARAILDFAHEPCCTPTSDAVRSELLADPGFGTIFSDHMVTIEWTEERGWHDAVVGPRQPISLDPAAAVLHYAQEIFEGLKVYKQADGSIALFRPEANAARFKRSAKRLAMPELPDVLFVKAIEELVGVDLDWIPSVPGGSLYLRPFLIATESFLGVRPAKQYKFIVIASPAGNYFKSGAPAISVWVSDYARAALGGTGAAKCGGNYAASLVPQGEAIARGHDQVVFLDAAEQRWVEELGGMNLFFVFADGTMLTPALTGTILAGITRDSVMTLAREEGLSVTEGRYGIDHWREDALSGKLVETFACGTAAVVTAVGKVSGRDGEFSIGSGESGPVTQRLKARLVAIQRGEVPDSHGWIHPIARTGVQT